MTWPLQLLALEVLAAAREEYLSLARLRPEVVVTAELARLAEPLIGRES
ncbi:MAG: hypothetical protein JWO22_1060 [Frankiales bacterium]|nr:hypothetical protein [Frankiales bacterium]